MATAAILHVELALVEQDGRMIAGDERMSEHQVTVLQAADGERRVNQIDFLLASLVDQHQCNRRDGLSHAASLSLKRFLPLKWACIGKNTIRLTGWLRARAFIFVDKEARSAEI